jgi:hypothetical protein
VWCGIEPEEALSGGGILPTLEGEGGVMIMKRPYLLILIVILLGGIIANLSPSMP